MSLFLKFIVFRSVAPSVDSLGTNSSPFDQFETVVEVAEIPENISDTVELGEQSLKFCIGKKPSCSVLSTFHFFSFFF